MFYVVWIKDIDLIVEDFLEIFDLMLYYIFMDDNGVKSIFYLFFVEWFLDVKYCILKFFCNLGDGYVMLVLYYI